MRLVLLGPPGAGKGTQARILGSAHKLVVMTSGDMVRALAAKSDQLGRHVKGVMETGSLIDDELMIRIVESRLGEPDGQGSFVLDGFPRTLIQARRLDRWLQQHQTQLDRVIEIQVDDSSLIGRISGRFSCADCGAGYHDQHRPTKVEGVCDECDSSKLERRSDDDIAVVRNRLAQYHVQTSPLLPYYQQQGLLRCVQGLEQVQEVARRIADALDGKA